MLEKLLLKDREAAEILSCSRSTFRQRVADGIYPKGYRDCGGTRWKMTDLKAYVAALPLSEQNH